MFLLKNNQTRNMTPLYTKYDLFQSTKDVSEWRSNHMLCELAMSEVSSLQRSANPIKTDWAVPTRNMWTIIII